MEGFFYMRMCGVLNRDWLFHFKRGLRCDPGLQTVVNYLEIQQSFAILTRLVVPFTEIVIFVLPFFSKSQ